MEEFWGETPVVHTDEASNRERAYVPHTVILNMCQKLTMQTFFYHVVKKVSEKETLVQSVQNNECTAFCQANTLLWQVRRGTSTTQ